MQYLSAVFPQKLTENNTWVLQHMISKIRLKHSSTAMLRCHQSLLSTHNSTKIFKYPCCLPPIPVRNGTKKKKNQILVSNAKWKSRCTYVCTYRPSDVYKPILIKTSNHIDAQTVVKQWNRTPNTLEICQYVYFIAVYKRIIWIIEITEGNHQCLVGGILFPMLTSAQWIFCYYPRTEFRVQPLDYTTS